MNEWEGILKGRETRGIMRLGDKYACFLFWGSSQSLGFSQSSFRHIFSKSIGVKLCCQFSRGVTVLLLSSCNTASGSLTPLWGWRNPGILLTKRRRYLMKQWRQKGAGDCCPHRAFILVCPHDTGHWTLKINCTFSQHPGMLVFQGADLGAALCATCLLPDFC